MKTTAVRLHGAMDIRLERFDLPPMGEGELLLRVESDALCASTYKAVRQGTAHKRVPPDVAERPVIIGHETCGMIEGVGEKWQERYQVGEKVVIQPALKLQSGYDPGYSYPTIGGSATYCVVPEIVPQRGCLLPFAGEGYYTGSLVESLACVLRGFKGLYHTDYTNYVRTDGAKKGGRLAVLGGAGPMGIGAVELAVGYAGVSRVTVTDLSAERLSFAARRCTAGAAARRGVTLDYVCTAGMADPAKELLALSEGGYDDVFVMVPVPELLSLAERICREDGCINFFAGPPVHDLPGALNLYRVHYDGIHMLGTAGSIPADMEDVIRLIQEKKINPAALVSHICGLDSVPEGILAMAHPAGAKRVSYPHIRLPMTAIEDFAEKGKTDPLFRALDEITRRHGGLWNAEAEAYLLQHAPRIDE